MVEKPILFKAEMVRAILDGRKNTTRRVAHLPEGTHTVEFEGGKFFALWGRFDEAKNVFADGETEVCPDYQPGDILWVKETWTKTVAGDHAYKADFSYNLDLPEGGMWRSPRYMPRAAARIFLRVVDVRAEGLQEITDEDATAEGCEGVRCCNESFSCTICGGTGFMTDPRDEFMELWDSINAKRDGGRYAWDRNPFCWVYTFERVNPEAQHE